MSDANPPAEDMADEEPDDQPASPDERPDDQPASPDERPDGQRASDESADPTADSADSDTGSRLVTYVEYATFGILCLLALVATFRFYFAVSAAIRVWFNSNYVPVIRAAFNLIVLIAAAIGISVLVRRIA